MRASLAQAPETGNEITAAYDFNLMFATQIGPSAQHVGYVEPDRLVCEWFVVEVVVRVEHFSPVSLPVTCVPKLRKASLSTLLACSSTTTAACQWLLLRLVLRSVTKSRLVTVCFESGMPPLCARMLLLVIDGAYRQTNRHVY
jgi:hypothetical protein